MWNMSGCLIAIASSQYTHRAQLYICMHKVVSASI